MNAHNYTKKQVIEAVNGCDGVISVVAARLGCAWHTAEAHINKYPEAIEALKHGRAETVRKATTSLLVGVAAGDNWAIGRVLDTFGRDDGLGIVSRAQIDHTTGGEKIDAVQVRFVDASPPNAAPDRPANKGKP